MIIVDFETYSPIPIEAGTTKYAAHPDADIICMGYKIDDEPVKMWIPGRHVFPDITGHKIYAHNAIFDASIWHDIGCRRYDFPKVPLDQWVDTVALVNRYGYPSRLAEVGEVLNLTVQKQKDGKALIKRICVPTETGRRPELHRDYTLTDFMKFLDYCLDDIRSTYHLVNALPAKTLSNTEHLLWLITQEMNLTGLPVDAETAEKIFSFIEGFTEELIKEMPKLTKGAVTKPTQAKKIIEWCKTRGLTLDNLQAITVERTLAEKALPSDIRSVLQMRQMLGRSSTAKYRKIMEMIHEGRVHNNLQYHGAHTGRWAGRGLQLQNLPRAKVKNPEEYIAAFRAYEAVEDPVNVAKALIRPMICAPEGRKLIVSDYSSIENRILAWFAEDQKTLQLFREGLDQYKDMAAFMYGTPYDDITKDQRQVGKVIILGCGYGMGGAKFQIVAAGWGVELTEGESIAAVQAYRSRYFLVKQLWYACKDAMLNALRNPNTTFKVKKLSFKYVKDRNGRCWLLTILPSGRAIYYANPFIDPDGNIGFWGINPYSKKWSKLRLTPGTIVQNADQATARDIMGQGLINIRENMQEVDLLGTVHDEAIGEIDDEYADDHHLELFNNNLCSIPWATDLPLAADGYIAQRYRK